MGVDDRAAPSKVANNENGDKSIECVKQYVFIIARISRIMCDMAREDRSYILVNKRYDADLIAIINSISSYIVNFLNKDKILKKKIICCNK